MSGESITGLVLCLLFLVVISGFFSAAEIGVMSINRYRLNHLAKQRHLQAIHVLRLLQRPERLLGVILIGNTVANIVASAVATVIGQRLYGEPGVALATGLLTFMVLIFAEMMPKTLAAMYPETVAFGVARLLWLFLTLLSPLVSLTNMLSGGLLRLFGVPLTSAKQRESLTGEELRSVVNDAGSMLSSKYKAMFLGLLDLEKVTVNDIMVPRVDIIGIDISEPWDQILERLKTAQHTRLPVYDVTINAIKGIIHTRTILNLMVDDKLDFDYLMRMVEAPHFVMEGTGLYHQLIQFQRQRERSGLVVDEYGEILGLVTLEDILEEVVGEFTTDQAALHKLITLESEGVYLVDASVTLREFNRVLQWELPQDGPKTLNGLITEHLGYIPPSQCCIRMHNVLFEILKVEDNMVRMVRVKLPVKKNPQ